MGNFNLATVKTEMPMSPEQIFQLANPLALIGWLSLLASPVFPVASQRIAALAVPLLLSIAYAGLVLAFWSGAEGGFSTLADVMKLFTDPHVALAGWLHYLAFDLFVGAWAVRTAQAESIRFAFVIPCLALIFLFGPAGFLLFNLLRASNRPVQP